MHQGPVQEGQDLGHTNLEPPSQNGEGLLLLGSIAPFPSLLLARLRTKHLVILAVFGIAFNVLYPLGIGFLYLNHAAALAQDGKHALFSGDFDAATALFEEGRGAGQRAEELLRWPLPHLIGTLPFISHDYSIMIRLSQLVPEALGTVTAGLEEIRAQLGTDPASQVYQDGFLHTEALRTLDGIVSAIAEDLGDIRNRVSKLRADSNALRDVLARVLTSLDEDLRTVEQTRLGLDAAADLLEDESTFLLTFLSPSEARGGGGLFGTYALLRIKDGHLRLSDVQPSRNLLPPLKRDLAAPAWFRSLYGRLGALNDPRTINLSPTFSATAPLFAELIEKRTETPIDAVVSMDALVLGQMTRAIGPLRADGWAVEINSQNVRRVLLEDLYQHFRGDERSQNMYLKNLVSEVMRRISEDSIDSWEFIDALADSIARQRVKIWARDASIQQSLAAIGASGALDVSGPAQMTFNNNFSANKIDFYLHRRIDLTARFVSTDTVEVRTEVTLSNDVTDLSQSVMVRPGVNDDLPLGTNQMTLHTVVPEQAEGLRLYWGNTEADAFRGREAERKVIWDIAQIAAGAEVVATIVYRLPVDGLLQLTLVPHASARPDRFTVDILPIDDLCLSAADRERLPRIKMSGQLRTPLELKITQMAC